MYLLLMRWAGFAGKNFHLNTCTCVKWLILSLLLQMISNLTFDSTLQERYADNNMIHFHLFVGKQLCDITAGNVINIFLAALQKSHPDHELDDMNNFMSG